MNKITTITLVIYTAVVAVSVTLRFKQVEDQSAAQREVLVRLIGVCENLSNRVNQLESKGGQP